jgi:steroid delta-isomerase
MSTMANTVVQIRHVYDRWHEMITTRNLDGLMDLYADDSVLESSAVIVIEGQTPGLLRGKVKIASHFDAFFRMMGETSSDWYRFDQFFTNGRLLVWEYPSAGPNGDQLDVVESMDIENGLIVYHRVYWGWRGFEMLNAARRSDL